MSRVFTKVSPRLWQSQKFRSLNDAGQRLAYLYLLTCRHQSSGGVLCVPVAYLASDLGQTESEAKSALSTLQAAELIQYDEATSEVWIESWFIHNPPMNDRHAKGVRKQLLEVDSERLREVAETAFELADAQRVKDAAKKPRPKPQQQNRDPVQALMNRQRQYDGSGFRQIGAVANGQ